MNREDIIRMAREAGFADGVVDVVGFEGFANFAALVAAHERERIIAANAPEIEKVNEYIKALEDSIAEREKVAQWMVERGYATGHGDTVEDLLEELQWQAAERSK